MYRCYCPNCEKVFPTDPKSVIIHLIDCGFDEKTIRSRFVPLGILTDKEIDDFAAKGNKYVQKHFS